MYSFAAELRLILFVAILSATFFGWLSLWAAAGRFRWYWHIAPLALALAALVPMGGREPVLLFGFQAATIVFYEAARERFASKREGTPFVASLRFSVADAIAAIALICAVLAIGRVRPVPGMAYFPISPARWVFAGNGLGMSTLAGVVLITGRAGIWRRLLAALLLAAGAVTLLLVSDPKEAVFPYNQYGASGIAWSYDWALVLVAAQAAVTAAWLLLLQYADWSWWRRRTADEVSVSVDAATSRGRRAFRRASRIVVTLGTAWVVWNVSSTYWQILPPFSVPTVVLPTPNGRDDILAIDKSLNWNAIPAQDVAQASDQQREQFVADNLQPLVLIRESLTKSWMSATDYSDYNQHLIFANTVRNLCFALWADARFQAAQGRFDLAARDYLDMVCLANLSTLGGLVTEELVADAVADIGRDGLVDHMQQFDPPTWREIAYTLELLDGTREPIEAIRHRDDLYNAINVGWLGRLVELAGRQVRGPVVNYYAADIRDRYETRLRLTAVEAALRAYAAQHGAPPASLDALVPEYFTAVPQDVFNPEDNAPLIYRPSGADYLLYSVGEDGYDDHGLRVATPDPRRGEMRDLFFDSPIP